MTGTVSWKQLEIVVNPVMNANESWRLVEMINLIDYPEVVNWLRLQNEEQAHWDEQYQGFWILALSPLDTWLALKGL